MFAKVFEQIFDSSIASNHTVRHVFMDLLVLADAEGAVDMTYDAISRRTNVPIEVVVASIGELMKPDPESRSPNEEGARLMPLDKHRNWGWSIVNYPHYRQLRDEEARKAYFRDKKRESRKKLARDNAVKTGQSANGSTPGETVQPVKAGQSGQTLSTKEDAEGEGDEEVLPPTVPPKGETSSASSLRISDPLIAKRLISQKILGAPAERMWSPEAEKRLAILCEENGGLLQSEIDDIVWMKTLRREPYTATKLMMYWSDEVARVAQLRAKARPAGAEKPDPPRWREFFIWKNDNPEIVLPRRFELLSPDHKAEYHRDFQTFVKALGGTS